MKISNLLPTSAPVMALGRVSENFWKKFWQSSCYLNVISHILDTNTGTPLVLSLTYNFALYTCTCIIPFITQDLLEMIWMTWFLSQILSVNNLF